MFNYCVLLVDVSDKTTVYSSINGIMASSGAHPYPQPPPTE